MSVPPLLRDVLTRHSDGYGAARILVSIDEHDGIVVTDSMGEPMRSIEDLRRLGGLRERWRTPVISSASLSTREGRVEELMRQGYTSRQIGAEIGVSLRTVTSLRQKVRLTSSPERQSNPVDRPVTVAGRATILRDIVHDCLVASDLPVADAVNPAVAGSVAVVVLPSARELDVPPGTRIVTIGDPPSSVGLVGAARKGVTAVLPIDADPHQLIDAVRDAIDGRVRLSQNTVQALVDELFEERRGRTRLTSRERDILDAIARDEAMKQTARRLGISGKTVENIRQQLYRKLGARSAQEALAAADWITTHNEDDGLALAIEQVLGARHAR